MTACTLTPTPEPAASADIVVFRFICTYLGVEVLSGHLSLHKDQLRGKPPEYYTGAVTCTQILDGPDVRCRFADPGE